MAYAGMAGTRMLGSVMVRLQSVRASLDPDQIGFPHGGGETGRLIRALDWHGTSLGRISSWPECLRGAVALMLPAGTQVVMFCGPEYVAIYNDAYAPTIGDKHPQALGRPARENWSELWVDLEPLLRHVLETG